MTATYDLFIDAFLSKITERDLLVLEEDIRTEIVLNYMKRAVNGFKYVCRYNLATSYDDETQRFTIDIADGDIDEIVDIISEGMVVQWLKPYVNSQELLQNVLNTRDFTMYSPAELLLRVGNAYKQAQKDYTQMVREYSFNTGDLTDLHL